MKTTLFTQPFDSDDLSRQLGLVLIDLINSTDPFYNQIWIISAFANRGAVVRLVPSLEKAVSQGATIRITVGVDHQSTSIEALQAILALNVQAKIVHNNQPGHTFHPKIYLFEAEGEKAELFIGSHNLTEGGLFTNYEASTHMTFDFPGDKQEYDNFKYALDRFLNPPEVIVQPLTESLIENLIAREEIVSESQRRAATRQRSSPRAESPDQPMPPSQFGNERIPRPPAKVRKNSSPVVTTALSITRGTWVWQKLLKPSDVQRSPNGKPTGGVRLVQAGWTINNQIINQTRYFRFDVFGKLNWEVGKFKHEDQESTQADFYFEILGHNYGVYTLTISHKPSGEANQGNYTTMLHWGELSDTIKELNLGGRTFRLYAPTDGSDIFTIQII